MKPIRLSAHAMGYMTRRGFTPAEVEEATKIRQLRAAYGESVQLILFLCGYFGADYLGYEAAEGLDWVWEHRMDDLLKLGL